MWKTTVPFLHQYSHCYWHQEITAVVSYRRQNIFQYSLRGQVSKSDQAVALVYHVQNSFQYIQWNISENMLTKSVSTNRVNEEQKLLACIRWENFTSWLFEIRSNVHFFRVKFYARLQDQMAKVLEVPLFLLIIATFVSCIWAYP